MYAMFSFTGIYACLFGWSWQATLLVATGQGEDAQNSESASSALSASPEGSRTQGRHLGETVQFSEEDRAQEPARMVLPKQKLLGGPDWPITIQELLHLISASCVAVPPPCAVSPWIWVGLHPQEVKAVPQERRICILSSFTSENTSRFFRGGFIAGRIPKQAALRIRICLCWMPSNSQDSLWGKKGRYQGL